MPAWLAGAAAWIGGTLFRSMWPRIVAAVMWLFKSRLGLIISTAFAWLGINLGTVKLIIEPAVDTLLGYANAGGGGGQLASVAWQWMGVLQFDRALTMIISAVVARNVILKGRLYLFKRGYGAKP